MIHEKNRFIQKCESIGSLVFGRFASIGFKTDFVISVLMGGRSWPLCFSRKRLKRAPSGGFSISKRVVFVGPNQQNMDEFSDAYYKACGFVLAESFIYTTTILPGWLRPRPGDVCLDLGANIGTVTFLMSAMVGNNGKVYAFEPIYHDVAGINMANNAQFDNWVVLPNAVSDTTGQSIEIEESDFFLDSSICHRENTNGYYMRKHKVATITIDDFVEKHALPRIDFVKIDIEGAEDLAIAGARRTLEKYHPRLSISSYHIDSKNEKQHYKLVDMLKPYGYKITHVPFYHIWAE
jgi:FkbM family methyltransferase